MSIGTGLTAGLGIASSIIGIGQGQAGAEAREQALNQRRLQDRMQATQQSLARTDKLDEIMSTQVANTAASGISLGSGSVKAISNDSYNNYLQDEKSAALNLSFSENAIDQEIANTRFQARMGIIGGITKMGFQTGSILRNNNKSIKLGD